MAGDKKEQRGVLGAVCLAFMVALGVKIFFVDLMVTQGRSMLPALEPGSVLVVNKAAYGVRIPGLGVYLLRWSVPRSGDMVVFYTPLGERAVKRCYYVREGTFFALGDNGLESFDSRSYGLISLDHILGKVVAVK
ncbi:MAG: S26 family signal peptidase [Spirochaetaceae bacterium]|jgi:signal peptidase I|nr:S26 family signal peptidase [Spirochaetaceae bacterium]